MPSCLAMVPIHLLPVHQIALQPVPEGAAVHPILCAFICSIHEIYKGGFTCPALDGRVWMFGANNRVSRSVSATIKGYYDGAYPNWSKTPNHVKITWFKCFAFEKTGVLPSLSTYSR
uniref:Uncharacterized protein n=1 Tax=Brassica oleracea TaxID=3712 RepID=A0A3P6BKZ5_BRAOL|nr:unnamed protein product [Brassica oleracea]